MTYIIKNLTLNKADRKVAKLLNLALSNHK